MTRTEGTTSHLDTLSRGGEDQGRKRESGCLYVTIQEAARRCGVSDKTIQRAIRAGTLPAQYPRPNRCEIAVSDLDTFIPGHIQTPVQQNAVLVLSGHVQVEMEQRVAALEQRIQQLEHLVAEVLDELTAPKRSTRAKARERTAGPLPKQFVSLLAFAVRHGVTESKVQTHVDMGLLPVKRGEWMDASGTVVTLALNVKGKTAFYQLYRDLPHLLKCPQCPHGYQDSVSGQG